MIFIIVLNLYVDLTLFFFITLLFKFFISITNHSYISYP